MYQVFKTLLYNSTKNFDILSVGHQSAFHQLGCALNNLAWTPFDSSVWPQHSVIES